jgi:hypothetical protein
MADRAACGSIIGAAHALLSTMLTVPKSLQNLDGQSRKTLNDWGTCAHICAVSVPNETNKEQIAALGSRNPISTLHICNCSRALSIAVVGEVLAMKGQRQPHADPFEIDERVSETPPRRPKLGPHSYIWHSSTQELLPILGKDDPGYEENVKLLVAAIRRWNGETK